MSERYSNTARISHLLPREYVQNQIERMSHPMIRKVIDSLMDGEWYTIRMIRQAVPRDEYDEYSVDMYLGKVQPIHYAWKPPKKLNWKERLRVLFTGEVPLVLREK